MKTYRASHREFQWEIQEVLAAPGRKEASVSRWNLKAKTSLRWKPVGLFMHAAEAALAVATGHTNQAAWDTLPASGRNLALSDLSSWECAACSTCHEMPAFYFETHFRLEKPWADYPKQFAIITAYATTGMKWTDQKNQNADRGLEEKLRKLAPWVRRVTGYSPSSGHAEPSWAVPIEFCLACDLGQAHEQDAIYYVKQDTLFVSYCDRRRQLVEVGDFRSGVHQEGSVPKRGEA